MNNLHNGYIANTKIQKVLDHIKTKQKNSLNDSNHDNKHITNTIRKIITMLKPNQWLRIGHSRNEDLNITKNFDKEQNIDMKPENSIWYSKGDWIFFDEDICCEPDDWLSIIEVDYSRILVLTTKEDYLEFEKHYCIYTTKKHNKQYNKQHSKKTTKNKVSNRTQKRICSYKIQWNKVAKNYDGLAIIPNPRQFFPVINKDYESHLWLKTFDVCSLAIWRQTDSKPITKHFTIGQLQNLFTKKDIHNQTSKYCNDLIKIIKQSQDKL